MAAVSNARSMLALLILITLSVCPAALAKKKDEATLTSAPTDHPKKGKKSHKEKKQRTPKKRKEKKKKKNQSAQPQPEIQTVADATNQPIPAPEEKSSWWSWFTERKTLLNMNYEELKEAKGRYLANEDYHGALKFMEKMVTLCTDLEELRSLMLEVADLLYETRDTAGNLEKAAKMYKEFITLYPGSASAEYASYKAILCASQAIRDAERDQTKTKETLELAQQFLDRSPVFMTYVEQVRTIAFECQERLLESDMNILNFYIGRGRYASANKRMQNIRKDYLELLPLREPHILTLECQLAQLQKNDELFLQKQTELTQKFPNFINDTVVLAQDSSKEKRSFANRF